MPLIGVACRQCGHLSNVSDALLGQSIVCPGCGSSFVAAASASSAPSPAGWRPAEPNAPSIAPATTHLPPSSVAFPTPTAASNAPAPGFSPTGVAPKPTVPEAGGTPAWVYAVTGGAVLLVIGIVAGSQMGAKRRVAEVEPTAAAVAPPSTSEGRPTPAATSAVETPAALTPRPVVAAKPVVTPVPVVAPADPAPVTGLEAAVGKPTGGVTGESPRFNPPSATAAATSEPTTPVASTTPSTPPAVTPPAPRQAMALADLVEVVEPSVVRIELDSASLGSGFVIDDQGTVVTNFHVMDGGRKAVAKFADGDSVGVLGFLLAIPDRDLCVIRIGQPKKPLRPVVLAEASPRKGEKVAAFGSPQGLSFSASEGVVSAVRVCKDLKAELGGLHHADDLTWIQTTTPISGGNSGGPLVNDRGEVVGVNTMSLVGPNTQNLNFAVSCLDVKNAIAAAKSQPVKDLAQLPKGQSAPRPESAVVGLPAAITLPSGRLVDIVATFGIDLDVTIDKLRQQAASGARFMQPEYPSGKPMALLCVRGDVLDGPCLASYENERPMTFAGYRMGKRHGNVIVWDEGAKPHLLAQYDEGKKYGICVFLEKGEVRLIEEFDRQTLKAVHLITNGRVAATHTPSPKPASGETTTPASSSGAATAPSESEKPADPALAELMAKLDEVEKKMSENEKDVMRWVRKNSRR